MLEPLPPQAASANNMMKRFPSFSPRLNNLKSTSAVSSPYHDGASSSARLEPTPAGLPHAPNCQAVCFSVPLHCTDNHCDNNASHALAEAGTARFHLGPGSNAPSGGRRVFGALGLWRMRAGGASHRTEAPSRVSCSLPIQRCTLQISRPRLFPGRCSCVGIT